jgi:TRAP-type C4-dicarboxylate transport system substrate-binding protein
MKPINVVETLKSLPPDLQQQWASLSDTQQRAILKGAQRAAQLTTTSVFRDLTESEQKTLTMIKTSLETIALIEGQRLLHEVVNNILSVAKDTVKLLLR